MSSAVMGALAASIGVPIAFAVLRKIFPYRQPEVGRTRSLEELRPEYWKWEAAAVAPTFVFVAVIGYLCFLGFCGLALWNARGPAPSRFLLLPGIYWAVPALFLGIILAAIPIHFLYKVLLRDRYAEYTAYCNMRVGFDAWKILGWMAAAIGCLSAIAVAAGLNCYTQITDQAIRIRSPLALHDRTYSFEDVDAIASVAGFKKRDGEFIPKRHYAIRFKDGTLWTTNEGLRDPDPAHDPEMIEFIAHTSGKPITEVQSIGDFVHP
jgi:hypothetical protein